MSMSLGTPSPAARLCDTNQMRAALLAIGWSKHSGERRFGPKAQAARWGLGLDDWPAEYGTAPLPRAGTLSGEEPGAVLVST